MRSFVRIRPLAALSVLALSAALLAACSSSPAPDADPSPTGEPVDLCSAVAPSGAASAAVTVDGAAGEPSTATFDTPLAITELESTVVEDGTGDPVEAGQLVSIAFAAFNADTGEELGSFGYGDSPLLPAQISPDNPIGQVLGCATPGTRVVATFPPTEGAGGEVYIFDFLAVVPVAAWGEPETPVPGMPTVELDSSGAPTITVPGGDAPADFESEVLKKGDGAVVQEGDTVLLQYTGALWTDGTVFDSSWTKGAPTQLSTEQVVPGFKKALVGQTVGSQVLAVIPPADGYGEAGQGQIPPNATLVFVIDILGLQRGSAG